MCIVAYIRCSLPPCIPAFDKIKRWGVNPGMIGYTKMFGSMLDSTVWQLSKEARLLWITLLLKKDRDQVVRGAIPGLAHAARLTVEETEAALTELQKPDKYSQSQDHEGRRIMPVDGGWYVINGEKYRDRMSADDRREYNRLKQAEYRQRRKNRGKPLPGEQAFEKTLRDHGMEAAEHQADIANELREPGPLVCAVDGHGSKDHAAPDSSA